tara:strand:- start:879 stop:1526 length:648 start_codon:yes stop_codon:yes gene_type:complete
MKKKIAILDYGFGNTLSVLNALKKCDAQPIITRNDELISDASGLIIPGVGAFEKCMNNILKYGVDKIIFKFASSKKPILGICLGLQILFQQSFENGVHKGLGFLSGNIDRIDKFSLNKESLKIPHVTWSRLDVDLNYNCSILKNIKSNQMVYFVHSYCVDKSSLTNKDIVKSHVNYFDVEIVAVVQKENIYGCQFHPEKSGVVGLNILKNFINIC